MRQLMRLMAVILVLILANSFIVLYTQHNWSAQGSKIWVDKNVIYPEEADGTIGKPYKYIQQAIDAAQNGDIVCVLPGEYPGNLVIDKSITLTSQGKSKTILRDSTKIAYMIDITADSVSLEGFTFYDDVNTSHRKAMIHIAPDTNDIVIAGNDINQSVVGYGVIIESAKKAVIKNNFIYQNKGIDIVSSSAISILNNTFKSCPGTCIRLRSSNNNYIEQNTQNSSISSYGIYIDDSSDNAITKNTVVENDISGMVLRGGTMNTILDNIIKNNAIGVNVESSDCSVSSNSFVSNGIGINLGASRCIVQNNTISQSTSHGIYTLSESHDNIISKNTFSDNVGNAQDGGVNQWDDGTVGNYWDDYYGPDNDNDGFGDISYIKNGVNDNYPTGVFQKPPVISDPSPANLAEGISKQPSLRVKVTDPELGRLTVYFYYILNNKSYLIDVAYNVESGKTASVPFYSMIEGKNAVYTYMGQGYDYIGTWYVVAEDMYSQTKSLEWIFSTLEVPINNHRPVANTGGPYSGEVGDVISFDGTKSTDDDGTIEFIRWSFGDGTNVYNVRSPSHAYQEAGTWQVSLVVIDNNGASTNASTVVTVGSKKNDPPVAYVNGNFSGVVDQSVQFSSLGSYDLDAGDRLSYLWNFGDEITSTEQNPTHKYSKIGQYLVTLTITDTDGLTSVDSGYVTVTSPAKQPGFEWMLLVIAALVLFLIKKRKCE